MEKLKFSAWRFGLSAALFVVLGFVINNVGAIIGMKYYTDPDYLSVWSKVMMPYAGPPPMSFFLISVLFMLVSAILFAGGYVLLGCKISSKSRAARGALYGLAIFLIGSLPGFMSIYLLINLPVMLIAEWVIESFIGAVLGGMIVAGLNK